MTECQAVVITGGTGFLGRSLVAEFLDAGYRVGVLCRATSDRSGLEGRNVFFVTADIGDPRAVGAALLVARETLGPFALVHNAALISYRKVDAERLQQANVDGTRHVLNACQRLGVERVVHVSSVVTVGVSRDGLPVDESAHFDLEGMRVNYVDTKRAGEQIALQDWNGMSVTVVNPGAIFGPATAESNSGRFLIGMAKRRIGRLAPPGGMAAVGVWDCAVGVRLALEKGKAQRRYVLAESYLSSRGLFACVGQCMHGQDPVWLVVPRWGWRALSGAMRIVALVREPKMTTPQAMRMLGVAFQNSGQRAREELGWQPQPFAEVIQRTVREMVASGVLPEVGQGS